jgi:hypothetical protein
LFVFVIVAMLLSSGSMFYMFKQRGWL